MTAEAVGRWGKQQPGVTAEGGGPVRESAAGNVRRTE